MHNFRREHDFMRGELGVNASSVGPFCGQAQGYPAGVPHGRSRA